MGLKKSPETQLKPLVIWRATHIEAPICCHPDLLSQERAGGPWRQIFSGCFGDPMDALQQDASAKIVSSETATWVTTVTCFQRHEFLKRHAHGRGNSPFVDFERIHHRL